MAVHNVYKPGTIGADPETALDSARDGTLRKAQGTLREEERLLVSGVPARRLVIAGPDNLVAVRLMVLKDHTLYQAICVGPPGSEDSAEARHFISSLALVDG